MRTSKRLVCFVLSLMFVLLSAMTVTASAAGDFVLSSDGKEARD